ncbi:MAG: hypothetical protein A2X94_14245 [Bdellovibrionales bacterium GWB1_55_8]|nr:MAG: hypothetical protein A2X94_14245 [Bdellovibrionales bacterium GWB1_55_8]
MPHDIGLIPMHSGDSPESGLIVRECRLQLLDPLATPSDCWLLRRSQDVRIVNDQWIIDLVGPGPTAGRWTRVSPLISQTSDGHSRWQWEPSGKNGFIKENGLWLFEGKRPHFNEFHWTFTSKAPRLTYYEQSEPVCDYFSVGPDRTLLIAANSEIAQQKWPAIQASVLNEYRYTVTAPRIATPNWKILMSEEKQVPWRELMGLESATAPSPSRQQLIHEIQAKTSPLAELFAKVEDEELRTKLILEMSKMQCSALVWTVGQKIRFGAKIRDSEKTPKSLMIEPPASLNPAELQEALQSAQSQLFVNVSLYRGGVFFVAEEVYIRDSLIEVVLPKLLYQVQRRSHFRLYVPEEKAMFIRIGDQFHRILNLSGGGAAFATGQVNSAVFTNGTMLPKVSFQIYNEKIHCKAEVRWSKPFADAPEGSELTVGLQFHNLREADEQRLNLYVLEEGFEYFRQHVLSNP